MNCVMANTQILSNASSGNTLTLSKIIETINDLSAYLICACYLIPSTWGTPLYLVVVSGIWAITNKQYFRPIITTKNLVRFTLVFFWLFWSYLYIYLHEFDYVFNGYIKGVLLSLFSLEFFRVYFENHEFNKLRRLCIVSILLFAAGTILTIFTVGDNVGLLKAGVAVGAEDKNVGSFGQYYGCIFVFGSLLYLIFNRNIRPWFRLLSIVAAIASIKLLMVAQFTISYIITAVFISCLISFKLIKRNYVLLIMIIPVVIVLMFIGIPIWTDMLQYLSRMIDSLYISERLQDMATFINGADKGHTAFRLNKVGNDIAVFFKYPLTGIIPLKVLGVTIPELLEGHNSFFNIFAAFGLFIGSGLMYFVVSVYKDIIGFWRNDTYHSYILAATVAYICLSFINPTINVPVLSFIMMGIIPSVPLLTCDIKKNMENGEV